jgi:SagB-type dehydrogenase family enzyme
MIGLAPGVCIRTEGAYAIVERPGGAPLSLPGESDRLRRLTEMLATPMPEEILVQALVAEPGASPPSALLRLLQEHGVLVPYPLGPLLIDLHHRTVKGQSWPLLNPGYELKRFLRDHAGDVALALRAPRLDHASLAGALRARRSVRRFTGRALSADELGTLLGLGAGTADAPALPSAHSGPPGHRTYPSGGALYPIEVLVHAVRVQGLDPGIYLYQVLAHRLTRFTPIEEAPIVEAMLSTNGVERASLLVYLFMDFARPCLGKYGEKAYRLALLEAGHLAQNLLVVAAALKLAGVPLCGFDDEQLSLSAGLSFPQEAVVYALALGEEHDAVR